jgi:hypothetical protein
VYRRLADAVGKQEDVFAECKSIRDAIKHLSGLDENLNPKPAPTRTRKAGTGSTAAALEPPGADTSPTGLKAELENAGADEIIVNIQDDADKLEEVAKASIVKLSPDKVYDALINAWTDDQLRELIRRVNMYLGPPTSMTTTTTTTDFARRAFTQPTQ